MNANVKKLVPWGLVAILAVISVLTFSQSPAARAQRDDAAVSGPRYSVIDSEAHNLIVVDNKSNTLYFDPIDKGRAVQIDLKLPGAIDLQQVGQPTVHAHQAEAQ